MSALLEKVSWFFGGVSAIALITMMMITVTDVVLRLIFNIPIFGTFDIVELCLVTTIFFAIPGSFIRKEHLVVDLIDQLVSSRVQFFLTIFGTCLALAFMTIMGLKMIQPFYDSLIFKDKTLDLGIPKFLHWIPILLGTAGSVLGLMGVIVEEIISSRWRKHFS